jgi:NAD-dependent deacetylase
MFDPALISILRTAKRVVALTGAGVSAESGVPTFRDSMSGLWAQFKPEELASPDAFMRNPKLVWEWYAWRRKLVSDVKPNPGHHALAELERRVPSFTLITQNVDSLHQRAGSKTVIELHGNISRVKCSAENKVVENWQETSEVPPHCPNCKTGLLRPDVVWFGEMLPERELELSYAACVEAEIFFSIGTSALVHPAAKLPLLAVGTGAKLVEINPTETPLSRDADFLINGPSGKILPELLKAVWADVS